MPCKVNTAFIAPFLLAGMNIFVAFFLLLLLLTDNTPPAAASIPLIGNDVFSLA